MFIIDGNVLAQAISLAQKVVGKEPTLVLSHSSNHGNCLLLRGYSNDGRYITYEFPASKVDGKFKFGVPADRLVPVASKRAALQFNPPERGGGELQYSAVQGSYKGYVQTLEVQPVDFPKVDAASAKAMSGTLKLALFDLFDKVSLTPMFANSKDMVLFVEISDGIVSVASADNFHAALVESVPNGDGKAKRDKKPVAHTFPFRYVSLIATMFSKSANLRMLLDTAHLHVFDDNTTISLPLMDLSSEGASMDGIKKYFASFAEKKPSAVFEANVDDIKLCLENTNGIRDSDQGSTLNLLVSGTELRLRMESKHGAVSDRVSLKSNADKASMRLEPNTVEDLLARVDGECRIQLFIESAKGKGADERRHIVIAKNTETYRAVYLAVGVAEKKEKS
jgi:hypothetical protein